MEAHHPACLCSPCLASVRLSIQQPVSYRVNVTNTTRSRRCENSDDGAHHRALVGLFCKFCGVSMP